MSDDYCNGNYDDDYGEESGSDQDLCRIARIKSTRDLMIIALQLPSCKDLFTESTVKRITINSAKPNDISLSSYKEAAINLQTPNDVHGCIKPSASEDSISKVVTINETLSERPPFVGNIDLKGKAFHIEEDYLSDTDEEYIDEDCPHTLGLWVV